VGVAIEVKSNVEDQWNQVEATAATLAELRQQLSGTSVSRGTLRIDDPSAKRLPIFAVGYKGWKSPAPIEQKLMNSELDGVLVLEDPLFVESDRLLAYEKISAVQTQAELSAHKRIMELDASGHDVGAIADKLNVEGLTSSRVSFGDERYLPSVEANAWTSREVETSLAVLRRKVVSHTGTEALLAFVSRVHTELSKRSGMSVDLHLYR
jgi:hypothetical protein